MIASLLWKNKQVMLMRIKEKSIIQENGVSWEALTVWSHEPTRNWGCRWVNWVWSNCDCCQLRLASQLSSSAWGPSWGSSIITINFFLFLGLLWLGRGYTGSLTSWCWAMLLCPDPCKAPRGREGRPVRERCGKRQMRQGNVGQSVRLGPLEGFCKVRVLQWCGGCLRSFRKGWCPCREMRGFSSRHPVALGAVVEVTPWLCLRWQNSRPLSFWGPVIQSIGFHFSPSSWWWACSQSSRRPFCTVFPRFPRGVFLFFCHPVWVMWKCGEKPALITNFHQGRAAGPCVWHPVVCRCSEGVLGVGPLSVRATSLLSSSSFSRQGWILGCYHSSFSFHAGVGSISALAGGTHGGGRGACWPQRDSAASRAQNPPSAKV